MNPYTVCYVQHELMYVRVNAKNRQEAERKFKLGGADLDQARGYGDFLEHTFHSVEREKR